jgi:endonuclease III
MPVKKTKAKTKTKKVEGIPPKKVLMALKKDFPEVSTALDFINPLELLIATILSAQCTDVRVNIVTKDLFKKYKKAADFVKATPDEIEDDIRPTGFFRNKAKSIQACCTDIIEKHAGKVPDNMDDLVKLHGVGRKTASCVLGAAFGKAEGVVVDTHVGRLSQRMGLTAEKHPEKIEKDLMELFPKKEWITLSWRLIEHGRNVCGSRKPKCAECSLEKICPKVDVGL